MRTMPPTIRAMPSIRVSDGGRLERVLEGDDAGGDIEHAEQQPQKMALPQSLTLKAAMISATPAMIIMMPMTQHRRDGGHHDAAQRDHAGDHEDDAQRHDPSPLGAQGPQTLRPGCAGRRAVAWSPSWRSPSPCGMAGPQNTPGRWHCRCEYGTIWLPRMQAEMNEPRRTGRRRAPPPPSCCCARPSPATRPRRSKSSWWCATTQIDAFSGALVFPGGKLEDADGDAAAARALRRRRQDRRRRAEIPRRRRARGLRGMRRPAGAQARPARR